MQQTIVRMAMAAGASLIFSASAAVAAPYTVTELPVPTGFTNCNVSRVNDASQIAGTCYNGATTRAVLWQNGVVTVLPVITGFENSTAASVGPSGQVVGWGSGSAGQHAMLWSGGAVHDLGLLPGTTTSFAGDVNAAGTIVGSSDNHAVEWTNGQILDFGGNLNVRPDSINASGQFVGSGVIASGDIGGSIIDAGRPGSPLRYLKQSKFGAAQTINDHSEVVGYDSTSFSSPRIPWQWQYRKFTYLPFLPGTSSCQANGLNDDGITVGVCFPSGVPAAVIWRRAGVIDLNTQIQRNSGWQLVVATTINGEGTIVGDGNFGGQFQAFMLVPKTPTVRTHHPRG